MVCYLNSCSRKDNMNAFVSNVFVENMNSNLIILFFVVVRGIASDVEGRCFDSRTGQIGPSVTIAAVFFRSSGCPGAESRKWAEAGLPRR